MPTVRPAGPTLLLTAALLALSPLRPAAAQTPTVGFTAGAIGAEDNATDVGATGYSLGFEFTANSPTLVTALGFFNDPSFDPAKLFGSVALTPPPAGSYTFADSHDVGLYQVVGGVETLVASATVTSASTSDGDFLYQSLTTPVLLAATTFWRASPARPTPTSMTCRTRTSPAAWG